MTAGGCAKLTIDWRRVWLAAGLGILAFAAVLVTLPDYGVTWDEGGYFATGERYRGWLRGVVTGELSPLAAEPFARTWLGNPVYHPPLGYLLSVATVVATDSVLGPEGGQRVRSALLLALTVATGTWWLARRYSLVAGLAGGWAMLCLPRLFGDAHLATTDMPLACFWLLTALAFYHEWEGRRRPWLTTAGLALMLLAKHSAILILLAFVPCLVTDLRRGLRFIIPALAGAVLGYLLLQPQLWVAPAVELRKSWSFFIMLQKIAPIPVYYFGELYPFRAGWHYGFVMLAVTTPLPVLAALFAGVAAAARSRARAGRHLLLHACLLPLVMAVPFVPTYDGVRLILPALPFLGLLAGVGMASLLAPWRARWRALLLAVWLAVAALPLWQYAPRYYLSYYNELIGGLPGAAAAGMETTYFGEALGRQELAWLNRHLPAGARVHFGGLGPRVMEYHLAHGLLRRDVHYDNEHVTLAGARARGADFLLLSYRWNYIRAMERIAGGSLLPPPDAVPVYRVAHLGVPLLELYDVRQP